MVNNHTPDVNKAMSSRHKKEKRKKRKPMVVHMRFLLKPTQARVKGKKYIMPQSFL